MTRVLTTQVLPWLSFDDIFLDLKMILTFRNQKKKKKKKTRFKTFGQNMNSVVVAMGILL